MKPEILLPIVYGASSFIATVLFKFTPLKKSAGRLGHTMVIHSFITGLYCLAITIFIYLYALNVITAVYLLLGGVFVIDSSIMIPAVIKLGKGNRSQM